MRLHDLSEDIIFDELENDPGPNKMFFISSVLTFPNLLLKPNNFSAKIYTSLNLTNQMLTFFSQNDVKLDKTYFVKLKSNVPLQLQDDKGEPIEVVMFESEDINKNVMFMFRKGEKTYHKKSISLKGYITKITKKTTHVYAGVCRELRSFIFNSVFVEWIKAGVCKLYVDVSRATTDGRDSRELENTIDAIENILNKNPKIIILNVPKWGYETLVFHLSQRLRARVSIGGIMCAVFQILNKNQYFVSSYKDAKILIVHKSYTLEEMQTAFKAQNYVFVQITDKTREIYARSGFYELGWSPLPSAFELQLLATILHPDRIYAIHHGSYDIRLTPQVPLYLLKLCRYYAQILEEMQQGKNKEIKTLEDISLTKSSLTDGTIYGGIMKLTQDVSTCEDREKRVHEWLTGVQENVDAAVIDENSEANEEKKVSPQGYTNRKANKRDAAVIDENSEANEEKKVSPQGYTNRKANKRDAAVIDENSEANEEKKVSPQGYTNRKANKRDAAVIDENSEANEEKKVSPQGYTNRKANKRDAAVIDENSEANEEKKVSPQGYTNRKANKRDAAVIDENSEANEEKKVSPQGYTNRKANKRDAAVIDENSEANEEKKVSPQGYTNRKANKSSSITKSLAKARQNKNAAQPTTSANIFRIQKGSLKYLEDSDSN